MITAGLASIFILQMLHLLFASRYLLSSLTLPQLFAVVQIEQAQKDAQPDISGQWNVDKLESAINLTDTTRESIFDSSNVTEAFKKCDELIVER